MSISTDPPAAGAARPPAPSELPRADVVGVDLAITDYGATMDWMDDVIRCRGRVSLTAAAVHLVMVAREEAATMAAVRRAVAVPDGMPLVWALRALGHRDATRVYGPDLMAAYCARAAAAGTPMYLYGGRTEAALGVLRAALRERFPGINLVGGWSPPFRELTEAERDEVAARINATGAEVVWVGTGQPKQERWMAEMRDRLEAPVLVGVGAAFDFHAGLVSQAPRWMMRLGLEWAYRLSREPRRLWRRYARYNPLFVAAVARQLAAQRARR